MTVVEGEAEMVVLDLGALGFESMATVVEDGVGFGFGGEEWVARVSNGKMAVMVVVIGSIWGWGCCGRSCGSRTGVEGGEAGPSWLWGG